MTSGVKDHLIKVLDNSVKYMYKNFRRNIMSGSGVRSFQSYNFILNDFIEKNVRKGHSFHIFFGHSMTSEVEGHLNKVVDKSVKYLYKNFHTLRKTMPQDVSKIFDWHPTN